MHWENTKFKSVNYLRVRSYNRISCRAAWLARLPKTVHVFFAGSGPLFPGPAEPENPEICPIYLMADFGVLRRSAAIFASVVVACAAVYVVFSSPSEGSPVVLDALAKCTQAGNTIAEVRKIQHLRTNSR